MKTLTLIRDVALREIKRMAARPLYILAVVVLPVLTIFFFCQMFSEGVPTKMPVAIVDLDQTVTSRKLIRNIDATALSQIAMVLPSESDAMSELRAGHIYGFVVLPQNLQAGILSSKHPTVSFYYQNGFLIAGGLIQNDLTLTLNTLSKGISIQKYEAMGLPQSQIMGRVQPIQVDTHLLYNPTTNYTIYISTIILPIMLQLFILMMTVYCIGIEIKERSSRDWLKTSGKSIFVALSGKLLPYTTVFFILMMFQNFLLYKVLMVPLQVNAAWLVISSMLFVLAYQAIGIFIIGLLPLMRHVLNLAAFYGILALTLCGFSYPVESMPVVFRFWAEGFPVRHFMHIFQNQMLAGMKPYYSLLSYVSLMLFTFLPFMVLNRLKSALVYQNFIEKISPGRTK